MIDGVLAVRVSGVIHERLDDEVIAIDLDRGTYYAMVGTAAEIWTSFERPATVSSVVDALARRYGASRDEVRVDVTGFVSQLEAVELVVRAPTIDGADRGAADEPSARPWKTPVFEAYDDMANLLLRDPTRQVDESGWPHLPDPAP